MERDWLAERRIRVARGNFLVEQGQSFAGLLLVRRGSCKSLVVAPGGQELVVAYHIEGEILGAEAIHAREHDVSVTALEDSEFWLVPVERITDAARSEASILSQLVAYLSSEVARNRRSTLMLATMRADQRLSTFLLDIAGRYAVNGRWSPALTLRMTRADIARYLGLSTETVSRTFSRLERQGLIRVRGRSVELVDGEGLRRLMDE